jgi:hypothetical protein
MENVNETVNLSLTFLDENEDPIQPLTVGARDCHIPVNNGNKANTRLDVTIIAGSAVNSWKDSCVQFKTKQQPQELKIKLVTPHQHAPTGKPLFHFIRVESPGYKLIKEIRCYTGTNPNVYQVVQYAHHFPEHTHTVDIVFIMPIAPGQSTPQFAVNLFVTRLDTNTVENADPQVGNEPPN